MINKNKKQVKNFKVGIAHILATFNNTIITISDLSGLVIAWSSAGSNGFKGTKKSTPYAATVTANEVAKKAKDIGIRTLSIELKGPGTGRETVVKVLKAAGINITTIKDRTSIPHNGCRSRKRRRV